MPHPAAANRVAYWMAVGLIWSLAVWHAWEARALFGDGANFFINAVQLDRFVHFHPARDYAMLASQVPLPIALVSIFTTDRASAAAWPHVLMIEPAMLTCQGLIVRSRPSDAVIVPIRNDADWMACSPGDAAAFGRFFWHGN